MSAARRGKPGWQARRQAVGEELLVMDGMIEAGGAMGRAQCIPNAA